MARYKKPILDEDRIIKDPERSKTKTFDRAVNLLTFKPRTAEELRTRLLEKPWTDNTIVDGVIEKLKEYNYINDEEFAANFSASKLREKPIGKRRLRELLYRKKLSKEIIEVAIEAAFEEAPEESNIDRAIEKRIRIKGAPTDHNGRQNFFGYLVRLGFDYDLIRSKMDQIKTG